jgi:hypothetical protein
VTAVTIGRYRHFLDVYVPIQFSGATIGAVEVYVLSQDVLEPMRRQIQFAIWRSR